MTATPTSCAGSSTSPTGGACGSWVRLYAGVEKFAGDLVTHMHLENDILFPRFEG